MGPPLHLAPAFFCIVPKAPIFHPYQCTTTDSIRKSFYPFPPLLLLPPFFVLETTRLPQTSISSVMALIGCGVLNHEVMKWAAVPGVVKNSFGIFWGPFSWKRFGYIRIRPSRPKIPGPSRRRPGLFPFFCPFRSFLIHRPGMLNHTCSSPVLTSS